MVKKNLLDIETILKYPEVINVTSNINMEVLERTQYCPPVCEVLSKEYTCLEDTDEYRFRFNKEAILQLPDIIGNKVQNVKGVNFLDDTKKKDYRKKRNIGIVFSGGPAPGGHNVIAGLYDAAKKANPDTIVFGFLVGPDGIIENQIIEFTPELIDQHRNLGGFNMIKTGRTKIDTKKKIDLSRQTCKKFGIDTLVIVGGDDSNTNAAFLAQAFYNDGIQVIGVPKTIDGDIQVRDEDNKVLCAISFGFHSAARSFAKQISNLCTDSSSDIKYWHICKVMGRVASHIALEVALQTHANMTLIGEELADYDDILRIRKAEKKGEIDYTAYGMTLRKLSRVICKGIVKRAAVGKNYGVIVIPEGVLEFINEIQVFITKLNTIIADYNLKHDVDFHSTFLLLEEKQDYLRRLARRSREETTFHIWNGRDDDFFNDMPEFFQEGLLSERDSHGNFQFSQVETEKVVMNLVADYLNILKDSGIYKVGIKRDYFTTLLIRDGFNPDSYGHTLFKNYDKGEYLIVKESIMSLKTLKMALVKDLLIKEDKKIPKIIEFIYKKSVPNFKTQLHFYGYDGRGCDPTRFDCLYTYNLGLTVFSIIANGGTGQMAAIKNLEKDFTEWAPVSIPIAPLMHLEERQGRLTLVIEKSIVDINSVAFRIVKELRDKWLAADGHQNDNFRRPGPIRFTGRSEEDRPITLKLNALGSTEL